MGYIKEPKNVDFIVGPSVFTEEAQHIIARAIAQYKETGQQPNSISVVTQAVIATTTSIDRTKKVAAQKALLRKRKMKI